MKRFPLTAFWALALATVAAFFITQHLKVTTPLITGPNGGLATYGQSPHIIAPADPGCPARSTTLFFHLLHHADTVQVTIVDQQGRVVRTLAAALPATIFQPLHFTWDGRLDDGGLAPPGQYNFRLKLLHQDRVIDPVIPGYPIQIRTSCPKG